MKGKKALFLFLALLLPICVFIFLKLFGKNEFAVKSLFQTEAPVVKAGCPMDVSLPYHLPDSIVTQIDFAKDSLVLLWFGEKTKETTKVSEKVKTKYASLNQLFLPITVKTKEWEQCYFFMADPYDLVLLNNKGFIRGEYAANSRDEVDRLFIELDIILKRY